MREILFRGKRKDNQMTVEGYYICLHGSEELHIIVGQDGQYHQVSPETVGQYTGLTDKNGKKIFEGDILQYTSYTGTGKKEVIRAVVFWDEHRWSYKVIYNNRWTAQWNNKGYTCDIYKAVVATHGEVIGNIHDNPELLEDSQ